MTGGKIRRSTKADGFTLVELLVAITLVALLTGVLFGGLRFGTRAASAVATRTDRSSEIALLYDFMQNEIADARLLPTSGSGPSATPSFEGLPDTMSFVTVPPAYLALGGFHLLNLAMQGEARTRRLMVSWQQVLRGPALPEATALPPSLLLDRLKSVEFAYFGVADGNQLPQWLDRWTGRAELPQLVRLRVVMADGWRAPDLIVAPRLASLQQ